MLMGLCQTEELESLVLVYERVHCGSLYTFLHHKVSLLSTCLLYTHPFNGPLSGTTQVSRYQKGKTNVDFTGARDSEWQWHWLGCMQVCTLLQTENHASTPPLRFLQAGCPSCRPTNSVKALKARALNLVSAVIPHSQLLMLFSVLSNLPDASCV